MQINRVTLAKSKKYFKSDRISLNDNSNKNCLNSPKNLSFKGKQYPSGYYTDEEISDAKRYMNSTGTPWEKGLYDAKYQELKARGWVPDIRRARVIGGICTIGLTEIGFYVNNTMDAKTHVERVACLISDLKKEERTRSVQQAQLRELEKERERLAARHAAARAIQQEAEAKIAHETEVHKIHTKLLAEFSDRVDIERKGSNVEIPNCIMLIDPHDDLSKELIDWTGRNSDCNFVKLADADNDTLHRGLWDTLVKAGETFEATKRRTLIHVEGFDRLITAATNAPESIAALKDVMCSCAQDYGSTIIFRTKDPSKLVVEAIQPHRVAAQIMVGIKSLG
ncbi:MAG: hypothetical protein PHC64_07490 [Candidatus Gastranaerophilales bacterium]|nr:hypothetical protein [Candidatus Gastranaerophilales bacterium]